MKKLVGLIVIAVIAFVIWTAYTARISRIREGVQGDPVRTVKSFMNTAVKLSGLMWDEEKREALKADLEKWEEGDELPPSLEEYGIEDTSRLFSDESYGKAVAGIVCLYNFDSFSVEDQTVEEDAAMVQVSFLPTDILGLRDTVAALGAPPGETTNEPISVPFYLKKRGYRWYIVEIRGELAEAARAFRRLGS
jgi:hypothetical protein